MGSPSAWTTIGYSQDLSSTVYHTNTMSTTVTSQKTLTHCESATNDLGLDPWVVGTLRSKKHPAEHQGMKLTISLT